MLGIADHVFPSTDGGNPWQVLDRPIRYENHKDPIRYEGDWTQTWSPDNSMSSVMSYETVTDRATLDFSGTGIIWVGPRGNNMGIADVYLDGELHGPVDQYAAEQTHEAALLSIMDLEPGPYSIEIEVTGQRNAESSGTMVTIDAFGVLGHATAAFPD